MREYEWINHEGVLCLSGHNVRIRLGKANEVAPFYLTVRYQRDIPCFTLASAKLDGIRKAKEIAEFRREQTA